MFILVPQAGGGLQLEDGLGNLLLENNDTLVLESTSVELSVQVQDENTVLVIPSADISNMPYFTLQFFDNIDFGLDGTGDFQGPADFEILEGPATFELRTPE